MLTVRAPSAPPPADVLDAFRVGNLPVAVAMGHGDTWRAGDVILKRVADEAEATWIADLVVRLPKRGFRLAAPIRAVDGRWVAAGWCAWTRVEGEHSSTRWSELLAAASAFHAALASVPKPEFVERLAGRTDSPGMRWRVADRLAWGEAPLGDLAGATHVGDLRAVCRPLDLPQQLVHGDLVGNVLFADGLAPAIIDLSLYWRPIGYAAALVVGDAITWERAPADTLGLLRDVPAWPQLLVRAILFRLLVNELARRWEPWRSDLSDEYRDVVRLAISVARGRGESRC